MAGNLVIASVLAAIACAPLDVANERFKQDGVLVGNGSYIAETQETMQPTYIPDTSVYGVVIIREEPEGVVACSVSWDARQTGDTAIIPLDDNGKPTVDPEDVEAIPYLGEEEPA